MSVKIKNSYLQGSILVVVLLVLVVGIMVVLAVGTRTTQDTQQIALEGQISQATNLAESAVNTIISKIEIGAIDPTTVFEGNKTLAYHLNTGAGAGTGTNLELCGGTTGITCDTQSVVNVVSRNYIYKKEVNKDDVLEINLTKVSGEKWITTPSGDQKLETKTPLVISFGKELQFGTSSDPSSSKMVIKFFKAKQYNVKNGEFPIVGECLITNITIPTVDCVGNISGVKDSVCPSATINSKNVHFTNKCFTFKPTTGTYSYARVRPLLKGYSKIQVSATTDDVTNKYMFPVPQYLVFSPNVTVGGGNSQGTKYIYELSQTLPTPFDYVLYNGNDQPIKKETK